MIQSVRQNEAGCKLHLAMTRPMMPGRLVAIVADGCDDVVVCRVIECNARRGQERVSAIFKAIVKRDDIELYDERLPDEFDTSEISADDIEI